MPYLTPDAGSGALCRSLNIPAAYLPAVTGALYELTHAWNWEAYGDITPDEAAAAMGDMYEAYFTSSVTSMIGAVFPYATGLPAGCLDCDGGVYLRVDYPALYDVLAAVYIDDEDHFHTPDLNGVFVRGGAAGTTGGEARHTLTADEMPAHTHTYDGWGWAASDVLGELPGVTAAPSPTATGSAGNGAPHNNLPPFHTMPYCIIAVPQTACGGPEMSYVGPDDPGAAGDGFTWIDTNYDPYHIKIRAIGNASWVDTDPAAAPPTLPPADYDSGWFAVAYNSTYTKAHGLGAKPRLIQVRHSAVAAPGNADREMIAGRGRKSGGDEVRDQLSVDATNITVHTDTNTSSGVIDHVDRSSASGYLRIWAWK